MRRLTHNADFDRRGAQQRLGRRAGRTVCGQILFANPRGCDDGRQSSILLAQFDKFLLAFSKSLAVGPAGLQPSPSVAREPFYLFLFVK